MDQSEAETPQRPGATESRDAAPGRGNGTGGSDFLPLEWREVTEAAQDAEADPSGGEGSLGGVTGSHVSIWSRDLSPPRRLKKALHRERHVGRWVWPVVSLVAALLGAVIGGGIVAASNSPATTTSVKEIAAGPALLNGTTNIETVIAKVLPSVVSIDATSGGSAFGNEAQGTGMIITSDGEVVTNNHVIAGATNIKVTLWGATKPMPATLIDTDPTNDVALLRITGATNLPTVSYGNSDDVQVGDGVVAIGNALGLSAGSPTVTQGIISATGRTVQAADASGTVTETLTNMFQTDAAINPGNSGGPLVDSSGKVIGMNTAVASSGSSQAQNIGFAIPANRIIQLLPKLRAKAISNATQNGSGYLGVFIETLSPELRSAYNFVPTQGAVVTEVTSGSPADVAGIEQGDVIVSINGDSITSADQLTTTTQADAPGTVVTIGFYRGTSQMTVTATLGKSPPPSSGG
jgi:putative serine protease PepD